MTPQEYQEKPNISRDALSPGLYLTATPIGNAQDITLRALHVLRQADIVLCEDTRVTSKLLAIHKIDTKLSPYHDHNAAKVRPAIVKQLAAGASVCLISDAGMPLISDPGYRLVDDARENDIAVTVVPGASAVMAAVALSGQPCDQFFFAGFLPPKRGQRQSALQALDAVPSSLVIFESPHRLGDTLADMADLWPGRSASVCRELTKRFEEIVVADLAALADRYGSEKVKGEIVIVVGLPLEKPALDTEEIDALLHEQLQNLSVKDAVHLVASTTGVARKSVYDRALVLKKSSD